MPNNKYLTPEELEQLFGVSVRQKETTTTVPVENPTAKRKMREGLLPKIAATGVRIGGGLLSSEGGLLGAGISGAAETLAQKIESPDATDKTAIGIESALGAVPFSKIVRAVKPGISLGKQAIANAGRMLGYIEAGNMLRRGNNEGHFLPETGGELAGDLITSGIGAALGGAHTKLRGAGVPNPQAAKDAALADAIETSTVTQKADPTKPTRLVTLTEKRKAGKALDEPRPVGLRLAPDAPLENPELAKAGRTFRFKDDDAVTRLRGGKIGAARVEDAAPMAPAVKSAVEEAAHNQRSYHINEEHLDSVGKPIDKVGMSLQMKAEREAAKKIAKAQRDINRTTARTEQQMLKSEERADLADLRARTGSTDLGAQKVAAAKAQAKAVEEAAAQEARNLNARDKFIEKDTTQTAKNLNARDKAIAADNTQHAKNLTARELAERKQAADNTIAAAIESGELKPGPRSITETTEKVPTNSGTRVLRQTFTEKTEKELDDLDGAVPADLPPTPPQSPRTGPIPKQDATKVAATQYPTEYEALRGLAGTGKRGDVRKIGRGKWVVTFEEDVITPKPTPPAEPPPEPPPAPPARTGKPKSPKGPKPAPAGKGAVPARQNPAQPVEPKVTDADVAAEFQKFTDAELNKALLSPKLKKFAESEILRRRGNPPETPPPVPTKPAPKSPKTPPASPNAGGKLIKPAQKAVGKAQAAGKGGATPAVPEAPVQPKKAIPAPSEAPTKPVGYKDSYEKMAVEAGLPEGAAKIDLAGAKNGGEVRNRIVNELQKYRKVVQDRLDSRGVDEKGQYTYSTPEPKPLTVHVPGGPTYTFKPELEQIDNALERFEKGTTLEGARGTKDQPRTSIDPAKAFDGIVGVETPAPMTTKIKPGYGSNFGAKGDSGTAPSYKLPINEKIPASTAKASPTAGPTEAVKPVVPEKAKEVAAAKVARGKAAAQKQSSQPVAAKDGTTKEELLQRHGLAQNADANEIAIAQQKAADEYFNLKAQYKIDGSQDTYDALRKAGEKYGNLKTAAALAGKAEGKAVPAATEPIAGKTPKGPNSDTLAALPPEKQEAELKKLVDKFKKTGKNSESGFITPEIVTRLGLSAAGAISGASMTPDDPITGAILGGAAGMYAPAVFRALSGHVQQTGSPSSIRALGEKVNDLTKTFMETVPDYYRASLLAKPDSLAINALAGPYGSAVMGSLELAMAGDRRAQAALRELMHPTAFMKEFSRSGAEAEALVYNSNERGDLSGRIGSKLYQKAISRPAKYMTQGDVAARRILMKHGFTELEARRLTLTSEPFTGLGKALGGFRKSKGNHGMFSFGAKMMLPFYRTSANQIEQSALRFPVVGWLMQKRYRLPEASTRLVVSQNAMSMGVGGLAYEVGRQVDTKEQQGRYLKLINNFAGPYGATASIGFLAGVASQKDDDVSNQFANAAMQWLKTGTPLPTADSATDLLRFTKEALNGNYTKPPYGIIPPVISSKEKMSIPTIERFVTGDPRASQPTENEYSVAVPFIKNPKLKKTPKSAAEARFDRMQERMRKLRNEK